MHLFGIRHFFSEAAAGADEGGAAGGAAGGEGADAAAAAAAQAAATAAAEAAAAQAAAAAAAAAAQKPNKKAELQATVNDLQAKLAAAQAAVEATTVSAANEVAGVKAQLEAMATEAATERRAAALTRMGIAPEYHDVAPKGDPKDPAAAQALEAWAAAHPALVTSRAPNPYVPSVEDMAKMIPGGKQSVLTNVKSMAANHASMFHGVE